MKTLDIRRFAVSFFMLLVLLGLLGYLTFIPVPNGNRDLIISVMSVILGAAAAAIPNLFGDKDQEKDELVRQVAALEGEVRVLRAQYQQLKSDYESIITLLVERHIIDRKGIA